MRTKSILSGWNRYLNNKRPSIGSIGSCWQDFGGFVRLEYRLRPYEMDWRFLWRVTRSDGSGSWPIYVFEDEIIFVL